MQILLLGGTRFLGRATAAAARDRGHDVVCLARGNGPVPDGVRLVVADRDVDDALAAVADRSWDAVVDMATQPGHVRRAVRDLRTPHRVQVSTANVYARYDLPEQAEGSATVPALEADAMAGMEDYGAAKVACEEAVRAAGGTATVVRAGLIGGPGDGSGRLGYYPWRFAHPTGTDVLVPPDLSMPMAVIDVDDLATWLVEAAERGLDGTFNATGPTIQLGDLLDLARRVADSDAVARPVPEDVVAAEGVNPWMGPTSLPLWVDDPAMRWFATLDTSAARREGLRTRPLEETLSRALAEEEARTTPRGCGLTDEEEIRVREALDRR
ncbi:NAD-dependent epimerase/dehydratase family protein [Ornithinimicrobium cerasi]|uniref:Nucleoside-diphosphate-sugar epimerase n=1 Tax=Ornithinimicrobium cerasi TaxID=2248773 RepID=A0A285VZC5_9MICO|nr:NAD-dependent epimerase/dehydratase family protein [Ornithinimicrobium cerasi]SOC58031.1 Nucleoside-diphosphate-sugar epimerase [Ornithinimicrobium cerasi]